MRLTLKPVGVLGSRYELRGRAGHLANLSFTWGSLHGKAQLKNERLKLTRRMLSSRTALERGTRVLVEARKEGTLSRAYHIRSAEGRLRLETDGVFRVSHRLLRGFRCVGRVRRLGVLRTGWEARFDDDLSFELCAFMLFHLASLEQETQSISGAVG